MTSEVLTERVQVLLTRTERESLEKLAAKEDRSLSYVARACIVKMLKGAKP